MRKLLSRLSCKHISSSSSHDKNKGSAKIMQRLRHNDPELTCLRISNEFHTVEPYKLIQVLSFNQTVEQLDVSGSYVATLSTSERMQFWRAISELPRLNVVSFRDFWTECPLPIQAVVDILGRRNHQCASTTARSNTKTGNGKGNNLQTGLVELDFSSVTLVGDIQDLTRALKSHTTLRQVQSWELHWSGGDRQQMSVVEMLLSLKQQLEVLSFGSFNVTHEEIVAISNALSSCSSSSDTSTDESCTCSDTSIKALRLRGGDGRADHGGQQLSQESCNVLANLMRFNTTLEKLELCEFEIKSTVVFSKALQHNSTCKAFHLFNLNFFHRHDMTQEENEALVELLQRNHTLESVLPGDDHSQVDLYLRLNRAGLRGIMVDVNFWRHKFLDLLSNQTNDLDCVFHLLMANPSALPITVGR